ncbi:unnamed protein product [Effrenium voratum]|nr:unnamed protein product [Effrenium voratum]
MATQTEPARVDRASRALSFAASSHLAPALRCRTPLFQPVKCAELAVPAVQGFFTGGGTDPAEVYTKELEETAFRYLPYLARAKRVLIASQRYIAYSSDVGESLRPVLKNWQVNLTYGIAGAYIVVDTGLAGYRKYKQNSSREHIAGAVAHTAVFQSIASLALPAVIIHTVVHQTSHFLDKPRFKQHAQLVRYGPSVVGLGLIPLMPLLDHPCEHAIDSLFDHFWPTWRAR